MMPVDLDAATRNYCTPDAHVFTVDRLVAVKAGKGGIQYKPVCAHCGQRGNAIAHRKLRDVGIDLSAIPVVSETCVCAMGCRHCSQPCEFPGCGTYEMTEVHHYWPEAIWGWEIAVSMTTAWLCQKHHMLWHQEHTPQFHGRAA